MLRERCAYYAYEAISEQRRMAATAAPREARLAGERPLQLIFRVANCFNPTEILQIGEGSGLEAFAALSVSSRSKLLLCGSLRPESVAGQVLSPMSRRISVFASATEAFLSCADRGMPFLIANHVEAAAGDCILQWILGKEECVAVVPDLLHDKAAGRLWRDLCEASPCGMSFTNGKVGVFVLSGKLPRQHYALWL